MKSTGAELISWLVLLWKFWIIVVVSEFISDCVGDVVWLFVDFD